MRVQHHGNGHAGAVAVLDDDRHAAQRLRARSGCKAPAVCSAAPLLRFDDDTLLAILGHLDAKDVCRVGGACRRLRALSQHPTLWHTVRLSGLSVTASVVQRLTALSTHVREVDLHYCAEVTDECVRQVGEACTNLASLAISGCSRLTDDAVYTVAAHCPSLRELSLTGGASITNAALDHLTTAGLALEKLVLARCWNVSDEGLGKLGQVCSTLTYVDLTHCQVSDAGLISLAATNPLQVLVISGCWHVTDVGVREVAQRCKMLRRFECNTCENVTHDGIDAIAKNCAQLQSLSLSGCEGVLDSTIVELVQQCPLLRKLDLSDNPHVSDRALLAVAKHCTHLEQLTVCRCERVSDVGLRAIAVGCPMLVSLDVAGCWRISGRGLNDVAKSCDRLRTLFLSCPRLTEQPRTSFRRFRSGGARLSKPQQLVAISQMLAAFPRLEGLYIEGPSLGSRARSPSTRHHSCLSGAAETDRRTSNTQCSIM